MNSNALGRGLSTLLKEEVAPVVTKNVESKLSIDNIIPGVMQPRKQFNAEKIQELADSITSNGLIQPIIVNKSGDKYEIIAGERRYRACKLAGIKNVPVIIRELKDREILEMALIENIQREELTAIEEAEGYDRLIKEFNYTQSDLAASVGKSRSHVANILRLNKLPNEVKQMVNDRALSMGHVRCLIGLPDAVEIAQKIVANDLNVRQAEELTRKKSIAKESQNKDKPKQEINDDFILLGQSLSEKFGVRVVVENSWNGGRISFHYSNLEELDAILSRLN